MQGLPACDGELSSLADAVLVEFPHLLAHLREFHQVPPMVTDSVRLVSGFGSLDQEAAQYIPIGSGYLLRMVLEVKVVPENGLWDKRMSSGWSWTLRDMINCMSRTFLRNSCQLLSSFADGTSEIQNPIVLLKLDPSNDLGVLQAFEGHTLP